MQNNSEGNKSKALKNNSTLRSRISTGINHCCQPLKQYDVGIDGCAFRGFHLSMCRKGDSGAKPKGRWLEVLSRVMEEARERYTD